MPSLGDRIKKYEGTYHVSATSRMPLMIRLDGRAFHTFTREFYKPFCNVMMDAMVLSAKKVSMEMQGFKAAYIQSDEVTFCITDYNRINSQGWFDYDIAKVVSISAALMSVNFNGAIQTRKLPVFDGRAFSIPSVDVVNGFLWRAKDWERNSLQMYARSFFSHKELHGKNKKAIHDLLHGIGKNWSTDLTERQKNGTFLLASEYGGIDVNSNIKPNYNAINSHIGHLFEYPN